DLLRVLTEQHRGARLLRERLHQIGEILTLAESAAEPDDRARQAFERRDRRADVGALRVVEPGDRAGLGHELAAMAKALEVDERFDRGVARDAGGIGER